LYQGKGKVKKMKAQEFVSVYRNYRWDAWNGEAAEIVVTEWNELTAKQQWKVDYDIMASGNYTKVGEGRYVLIAAETVEEAPVEEVTISEDMISNFREFKNVAFFDITVDGTTYAVKAEYHHQTIETEAPIKNELRKWFFMIEDEEAADEPTKANGNPIDEHTFKLINGDFYEGETVTVEMVMGGKQYTRKVKNDAWDLYITINGVKCYWDSDRID
jgi:hypothetical protein